MDGAGEEGGLGRGAGEEMAARDELGVEEAEQQGPVQRVPGQHEQELRNVGKGLCKPCAEDKLPALLAGCMGGNGGGA